MAFVPANDQLYKVVSGLNNKMVLDASQDKKHLNKLILYEWNNGSNQKFAVRALGANKYAFFCSTNNGTIEVPQSSTNNGAQIEVNQPNKAANEMWELVPVDKAEWKGKHAYYFKSFCGKCLDVC
jgi:hypothetical protein